jgi:hypothetical protein
MTRLKASVELLEQFEMELDPKNPERSRIPTRVLGYGEMSTTLEIGEGDELDLAYKRMPMFLDHEEADRFESLYWKYVDLLQDRVGVEVVDSDIVKLWNERSQRVVLYIVQRKLLPEYIGNHVVRQLVPADAAKLVHALLVEIAKVFLFNQRHRHELEIGLDGQISNWAVADFDPGRPGWKGQVKFVYFDTSSPLLKLEGEEQLSPELFLRSAPPFLAWILRLFFVEDVITRYYSFRNVAIALLGNLYKEGRGSSPLLRENPKPTIVRMPGSGGSISPSEGSIDS